MPLNLYEMLYARECRLDGMFVSPYAFARAANIIERLDLDDLIAQIFPIDQAKEAFEAHLTGRYPKVLIQCNPSLD